MQSETLAKLIPALIAAQREMGPAIKTATNPHFKSRYVDLEGAWEACREALWSHGMTVVQTTAISDGAVRLVTTLAHESGEWMAGEYPLRPVKDDPQGLGAALTYARRYTLMAIVGLAPEDDDGTAASQAPQRARQQPREQERTANGQAAPQQQRDPARAPSDGFAASDGPKLGTPTQATRDRWKSWLEKLLDRWHKTEKIKDEADCTAREHRIAHALITVAGEDIESLCYKPAEAGKDPVRDPAKVWQVVHRLVAGNFAWVRWATMEHLKRHVAPPADEPKDVNAA